MKISDAAVENLNVDATLSIVEILPSIRLVTSRKKDQGGQFFGQIGLGYYIVDAKATASASSGKNLETATASASKTEIGFNLGAGIILGSSDKIRFSIYPMYNIILASEESTTYFIVNAGIIFGF